MTRSSTPRVSIGVPVYNGERFLGHALESLLAQTFGDFELVISDNASTDLTEEIARSFADADERVTYVRSAENLGAAGNFKKVFHLTSGRYFKWAAHDDLCEPEFLERCVEVLDGHHSTVLCYTRMMRLTPEGSPFRPITETLDVSSPNPARRFAKMIHATWCLPVFGLIRRDALLQTSVMGSYMGADHVVLTELAIHGRFFEVPELLFGCRKHPGKYSHTKSRRTQREWWDPARNQSVAFDKWRKMKEHAASVARSSLASRQKLQCYGHVGAWALSNAKPLAGDVVRAVGTSVRSRSA